MRRRNNLECRRSSGFSLVELAVVVAIVAFLMGGLMYTLSAQTEQRSFEETRRRLEYARDLILAFAIVNGRLPCPARSANTASPATVAGDEVVTTATGCVGDSVTNYYGGTSGGVTLGLLPARSIGFQPVDASGFAIDAWGNRLRYAVANLTTPSASCPTPHFVNATNLKQNGVSCQPNDLLICKSANLPPAITSTTCGGANNQIMTQSVVVAIIFSTGKNGAGAAGGIDEAANLNGDRVFVYHTPTSSTATNGEFDDQFIWITTGEFYGKLIAAGQLP
jgi:prepilin-type N-terminal cleavage/methylation domain-containing protein